MEFRAHALAMSRDAEPSHINRYLASAPKAVVLSQFLLLLCHGTQLQLGKRKSA